MEYNYLSDVMKSIVENMTTCSNYEFGYWPDISNRLLNKGLTQQGQATKYPLIVLHSKFKQSRFSQVGILMDTDPTMYILARTQTNYSPIQRIEQVFKTVLDPIYDELIQAIKDSTLIASISIKDLEHEREDMFLANASNGEKNLLNDFLDVIEIKFKSIKLFNNC